MDFTKSWKTVTLALGLSGMAMFGEYYNLFDPGAAVFVTVAKWCMGSYAATSVARKIRDGMAAKK